MRNAALAVAGKKRLKEMKEDASWNLTNVDEQVAHLTVLHAAMKDSFAAAFKGCAGILEDT